MKEPNTDNLIINELRAENFKKLQVVNIKPGDVNVITGKNAQGKSSVLDAIQFCIDGPSKEIPRPIRDGATKAKIELDLGELVVTRTVTPSGARLEVTAKDGTQLKTPQAILNNLFNKVSFDPVRFLNLSSKDQIELLLKATGQAEKIAQLDAEREHAYNERRIANRKVSEVETMCNKLNTIFPEGEEISAAEIMEELKKANEHNNSIGLLKADMHRLGLIGKEKATAITLNNNKIEALRLEIDKLEHETAKLSEELQEMRAHYVEIATQVEEMAEIDVEKITAKLQTLEAHNAEVRKRKQYEEYSATLELMKEVAAKYSQQMAEIDKQKEEILSNTPIGIPLTIGEEGVLFGGVPLSQCSSAEQLKVSMAVAMALQPNLKVILIREGSLLDSAGMNTVQQFAAKNGYQIWIEKVDETGEVGIVIEEGRVKNA